MLTKVRQRDYTNLWNRLVRNLIYDAKEVLLYCGIRIPENKQSGAHDDYSEFIRLTTRRSDYGAIFDPITRRIHFEPGYIQNIVDQAYRFDFPVLDRAFGPGGVAGFIHTGDEQNFDLKDPGMDHILKQAMLAQKNDMPYSMVSARQMGKFESEQFRVTSNIFNGPMIFNITTESGVEAAVEHQNEGHYIITCHTIFTSPLKLSFRENIDIFTQCVQRRIPVMHTFRA